MRIAVHAVGRMKAGPESELADRFFDRFSKSGPAVGLYFSGVTEIQEGRAQTAVERQRAEAASLETVLGSGTALFLLDERGRDLPSEDIAARIAALRDSGRKSLLIAIGGPDGHDESLRRSATLTLAFGKQTWPHQIVRVMLAEQLYRVATILSGHPYHRA
jgi:23S rRNA (pseudouridine1915-N3)-methyltransferase